VTDREPLTPLLKWLILVGLIAVGAAIAAHYGLFHVLVEGDRSRLSLVIMVIFVASSGHAGWRSWLIAKELSVAKNTRRRLTATPPIVTDSVKPADASAFGRPEESVVGRHLHRVARARSQRTGGFESGPSPDDLLRSIRQGYDGGWFIADLMFKLGLVGTVIGFILMLGGVTELKSADLTAAQQMLTSMSGGMQVALFTTLTGLIAGTLLGLQYQLLDRSAIQLQTVVLELEDLSWPDPKSGLEESSVDIE
jgi:hypothetical protein